MKKLAYVLIASLVGLAGVRVVPAQKKLSGTKAGRAQLKAIKALFDAVENNDQTQVVQLLEAGANVNAADDNGDTALIWAAARGRADIIDKLLEAGANVNAATRDGDTALIWAARAGHTGVVDKLLQKGANVNAANKWGETALVEVKDKATRDLLEKAMMKRTLLGIKQ